MDFAEHDAPPAVICGFSAAAFFYGAVYCRPWLCAALCVASALLLLCRKIAAKTAAAVALGALVALFALFCFGAKSQKLQSLLAPKNADTLCGLCLSSPVKKSDGRYSFTLQANALGGKIGGNLISCGAKGAVTVFVDSAIVEKNYPGKLYSASGRSGEDFPCIDIGLYVSLKGAFSKNARLFTAHEASAWTARPQPAFALWRRRKTSDSISARQARAESSAQAKAVQSESSAPAKAHAARPQSESSAPAHTRKAWATRSRAESSAPAKARKARVARPQSETSAQAKAWKNGFWKMRAEWRLGLKKLLYGWGGAGGFLLALVSGAREYLEPPVKDIFTRSGLSHVLALSGLHLSFIGTSERGVRASVGKTNAGLVVVLLCTLFVWFAGVSPSLLRALLCIALKMFAERLCIKPEPLAVLAAAFLAQLCISGGGTALSLSFMLSYSATLGIHTAGARLGEALQRRKIPPPLAQGFAVACGAQLGTLPLMVLALKTLPLAGVLASIATVPLVSLFFTFGVFAIIIALLVPELSPLCAVPLNLLYGTICAVARFFAGFGSLAF